MVSATGAGNGSAYAYDGRAVLRWYAYGLGPNGVLNQMNVRGSALPRDPRA